MDVKIKFVLTIAVTATIITMLFGGFLGYRYAQDLENQFIEASISNANVIAEMISRHLNAASSQNEDALNPNDLPNFILMEGKFYAQVIKESKTVFVSGDDSLIARTPRPSQFSERLELGKRFLPNGTPYIDIVRVLDLNSPQKNTLQNNYVRLGFSMAQISSQITAQFMQIAGVGLMAILLGTLGAYFLASSWFNTSKPSFQNTPARLAPSANHSQMPTEDVYRKIRNIEIDEKSKQVKRAGEIIAISPREFAILCLLASDPGRVFSSQEILRSAWGENNSLTSEDVKKYVYQLRQKLELDPENPQLIVTIRGFGYKISSQ
jgi:DNA-binding response OmpR family regulator